MNTDLWGRPGSYLPAMDAEESEPIDEQDAIGRLLCGPVRLVLSLGLTAAAGALVAIFWSPMQ